MVTNFEQPIKVYIKTNSNDEVIEIDSEIFLNDMTGWIFIDEGVGDKFAHAQSQYLNKPIKNERGCYNFQYFENKIIEKSL